MAIRKESTSDAACVICIPVTPHNPANINSSGMKNKPCLAAARIDAGSAQPVACNIILERVSHAFSGSIETFRRLSDYGDWYVGIGGVLTYKNASIASTLKEIPLDRILLETDSPYLPPVPYRGTRNESSHIPVIAAKVAEIKGTGIEEVAERTTGNAVRLFGLPEPCGQRRETL